MDAASPRAAAPSADRLRHSYRCAAGPLTPVLDQYAERVTRAAEGLWRADPAVWTRDAEVQASIARRLGWLRVPQQMAAATTRLETFGRMVASEFSHVVLLGMGGSSLAPEVMRSILGTRAGWPQFHMIDSTDPAAVRAASTPPANTLYILASKSGTTIEPNALAAHFRSMLESAGIQRWADHFVAITDDGTELARRAQTERFREAFINPSDIGGRYSALSFFGLVPAAVMGHDVNGLLAWGRAMLDVAQSEPPARNPAVALGWIMGAGSRHERDKLTLLMPPALETFGLWIEQLVAESTGKHGAGVVPIAGEGPAPAASFGADRLFVYNRLHTADGALGPDGATEAELQAAGHPVVAIDWTEPLALGAEFMRWEIATAICGALLEINPFDEPNVQQAKDATRLLLEAHAATGELPSRPPSQHIAGAALVASAAATARLGARGPAPFLSLLDTGDYAAILAYLGPDPELRAVLHVLRDGVRARTGAATMFGYGPRYLHSTGQLHKGGPNSGVFLLITATPVEDVPIPGQPFSFGTLELAQARGDFNSLDEAGRRAVHVHLPSPDPGTLRTVADALLAGLDTHRQLA